MTVDELMEKLMELHLEGKGHWLVMIPLRSASNNVSFVGLPEGKEEVVLAADDRKGER